MGRGVGGGEKRQQQRQRAPENGAEKRHRQRVDQGGEDRPLGPEEPEVGGQHLMRKVWDEAEVDDEAARTHAKVLEQQAEYANRRQKVENGKPAFAGRQSLGRHLDGHRSGPPPRIRARKKSEMRSDKKTRARVSRAAIEARG